MDRWGHAALAQPPGESGETEATNIPSGGPGGLAGLGYKFPKYYANAIQ